MPPRFKLLAWTAATVTYLLIVLGAVVRITGSGMGCGDHWPLCNGRLVPPLHDLGTLIEWSHRLVAALVSLLVVGLAAYGWTLRRSVNPGLPPGVSQLPPGIRAAFVALALLIVQVLLGAITVKLELPPWSVILHLGVAMLLLAALLHVATASLTPGGSPGLTKAPGTLVLMALAFVTVLFGALTANLGAAAACTGFPLCNGQVVPDGGSLAHVHWTHRLLAYGLTVYVVVWVLRRRRRRGFLGAPAAALLAIVVTQVALGAATVLLGLPAGLQAAHLAVGTGVWAAAVLAAR